MEALFICALGKRASASAALIRPPTGTSPPGKAKRGAGRSKQDGRGTRQRAGTEWVLIRPAVPVHERIAAMIPGKIRFLSPPSRPP
jgi:hypothetical protein